MTQQYQPQPQSKTATPQNKNDKLDASKKPGAPANNANNGSYQDSRNSKSGSASRNS